MPKIKLLKENIYQLINGLSPSAVGHAARCKKLTEYILSCPGSREVFDKRMYSSDLVSAISCHDFGKAFVVPACVNLRYCETEEEIEAYCKHIEQADEYIKQHSHIYNEEENSFDKFLFECSTMHHEAFNGEGFPEGIEGEDIPQAARLCAVVDFLDNVLELDFIHEIDMQAIEEKLISASGSSLDPNICQLVLQRMDIFKKLCNDMYEEFKRTPATVSRLILKYAGQYSAFDYTLVGCETIASMWDADFGEVKAEIFRAAAAKGDDAIALDNLLRRRTFRQAELFAEQGVDFGRITVFESLQTLEQESYIDILETQMRQYDITADKLTVCVSEELLLSRSEKAYENLKYIRDMGIRLSVDGFGELCKAFDVFEDFKFDEIRLSKALIKQADEARETFEVMMGLVTVARNLGIDVLCSEVNSLEDERLFVGMGVNIVSGMLYGRALTEGEVADTFKRKAGVPNES